MNPLEQFPPFTIIAGRLLIFTAMMSTTAAQDKAPTDLDAVAKALKDIKYNGWVSVEPFDYHPTAEDCARISLENLKSSF